jgi:hypothetical protein
MCLLQAPAASQCNPQEGVSRLPLRQQRRHGVLRQWDKAASGCVLLISRLFFDPQISFPGSGIASRLTFDQFLLI